MKTMTRNNSKSEDVTAMVREALHHLTVANTANIR